MGNGSPLLHTIRTLSVALFACAALAIVEPARAGPPVPLSAAADVAMVVDTAVATAEPVVAVPVETPALQTPALPTPAPPVPKAPVAVPQAVPAAAAAARRLATPAPALIQGTAPVLRLAAAPAVRLAAPVTSRPAVRPARVGAATVRAVRVRTSTATRRAVVRRQTSFRHAHPTSHPTVGEPSGATAAIFKPFAVVAHKASGGSRPAQPSQLRAVIVDSGSSVARGVGEPASAGATSAPVAASMLPFTLPVPRPPTGSWPRPSPVPAAPHAFAFERPG